MFTHSEDFEKRALQIMKESVCELASQIESIDPTGKVVAIEEISRLKRVFDYVLQERREDTGAYEFIDVIYSYNEFKNEYNLAIKAIELNNK
jgi:hypothetical protein